MAMTKRERVEATAERIRHKMLERGMNPTTLGNAAGVKASVISRILSEGRDMKGSTLAGISRALRCTSDELLGIRPPKVMNDIETARKLVSRLDDLLWGEQ